MPTLSGPKTDLIIHSTTPFNAEPPLDRLAATMRTDRASFYVRSHGEIPKIETASWRLTMKGRVKTPFELGLSDLRGDFPRRSLTAVMQCAGNRRADMLALTPVSGDPWAAGAIGNAEWTGVGLADLLRAAGADDAAGLHVAFDALDACEVDGHEFRYGASIPVAKAMSPEVLLAYEMNGEPLAPEHGAPLRVVVPGYAGVRSVKWLAAITVQDNPSDNYIQARDYKLFPADRTKETASPDAGITINELPVNSAICEPEPHASLSAGTTTIRGWATASARGIVRVDVSIDGGRSWTQARLDHDRSAPWSWTLWQLAVELPKGAHELAVRAWDSAGQTQPACVDDVWNFKGYLCASWHRIPIQVG